MGLFVMFHFRSHWYVILIQNPGQFDHLAAAAAAAVRIRTAPKKHKKRLIVRSKITSNVVVLSGNTYVCVIKFRLVQ